jgi:putative heme iron utilization protein
MDKVEAARQARSLLRGARQAVLATQRDGQPYAALVTPATAPDLSPILWLSRLSEHARQLAAEPRCALLVQGPAAGENPQTIARVTVTGLARPVPDGGIVALKARWLAWHPYAEAYAGFGDFTLWRIDLQAAHLVGGFAAAARLRGSELRPDPAAVAAVAAAEPGTLAHMNDDHGDAVENIAVRLLGRSPGGWRLQAVDVDGCALARGAERCRLDFAAPVADAASLRQAFVDAARAARAAVED